MPLYEYECDANGHRFEMIRKFSDPPIDRCPQCGGTAHKLFSSPAIQFKGSGFYITDYAKKDSGGDKEQPAGAKDKDQGGAAKSDTAAKTDSPAKTDSAAKSDSSSTPAAASSASESAPKTTRSDS